MAQAKTRQSQDPYAQRGKTLVSSAQRLRGWVGSDPSRAPELADALIQLTEHRLLGHSYAAAAADAQESVRRAGEMLAAKGPIGPYTSINDAAHYVTAVVHLAAVQAGLGLPDAAGRTIESLHDIREQLRGAGLEQRLDPQTTIWSLLCSGRALLTSGTVAEANAYADAAQARLTESGLHDDPDVAYLVMDVDRLASDCRWAAGRAEEALSYLYAAKERYDEVVDGRLDEPGRLSPALLERLAEPLFSLYRDMADRLASCGEAELSLVTRRRLIELLRGLSDRLGDSAGVQLGFALTDLARDLVTSNRGKEADAASAEAAAMITHASVAVHDQGHEVVNRGTQVVTWTPLPASASYAATSASSVDTKIIDQASLDAERQRKTAAWLQAARPEARELEDERMRQARIEVARRDAERIEAERAAAEQRATEQAKAAEADRLEAEQRARAEEAERLERKRRREERIEAHRLEVERREAERLEAQRLEAERLELERLQAEIDELGERDERMAREQEPPQSTG